MFEAPAELVEDWLRPRGVGRRLPRVRPPPPQVRFIERPTGPQEQVAFGRPAEVLTTDVLRRTYGAELVVLAGGERAVAVDHHRH